MNKNSSMNEKIQNLTKDIEDYKIAIDIMNSYISTLSVKLK